MDLTLFWLILACRCTPSLLEESAEFFQSPPAIVLSQLNSTAELRCSTTSKDPIALYLKQRFSSQRELLYLYFPNVTTTIRPEYKHRLSVKGQCCDITLRLSELQTKDTNGYYCEWLFFKNSKVGSKHANETIIIVRDGDPEEECKKRRMVHNMLLMVSVAITVTMFFICIALLIWRCQKSFRSYTPHHVRHRRHHHQCLNSR